MGFVDVLFDWLIPPDLKVNRDGAKYWKEIFGLEAFFRCSGHACPPRSVSIKPPQIMPVVPQEIDPVGLVG